MNDRYDYDPSYEFFKNNYEYILNPNNHKATKVKLSHWVAALCHYIKWEHGEMPNWRRGIHYHLISRVPQKYRVVPGNSWRDYRPDKDGHVLGRLTECRYKEWIPYDWIIDKKNDRVTRGIDERKEAEIEDKEEVRIFGGVRFNKNIPTRWSEVKDKITDKPTVNRANFNHQDKRLVVISEKRQPKDWIRPICKEHGADMLCLGGQPSITRTHDLSKLAKFDDNRPMHVFYLSDCDYEGYCVMPGALMKQLQNIYPSREHELTRVLLMPEQVRDLDLPPSFDPLSHKKACDTNKTKAEVYKIDSGLDKAYELDALTSKQVKKILKDELEKHSNLDKDRDETSGIRDKRDNAHNRIDIDEYKDDYKDKREKYEDKAEEIEEWWNDNKPEDKLTKLKDIKMKLISMKDDMQKDVENEYDKEELDVEFRKKSLV